MKIPRLASLALAGALATASPASATESYTNITEEGITRDLECNPRPHSNVLEWTKAMAKCDPASIKLIVYGRVNRILKVVIQPLQTDNKTIKLCFDQNISISVSHAVQDILIHAVENGILIDYDTPIPSCPLNQSDKEKK